MAKRDAPAKHVPSPKPARNAPAPSVKPARNAPAPSVKPARNAPAPAEYRRSFAPRGIAALLPPVLRPAFRRRAPAAAALLAEWPMLAGSDLAARAAPVKFAAGTLTLACSGPVAMELQLTAPAIIQRLNLGLGSAMVERLRFVQQAINLPSQPPPASRKPSPPPPQNLPEGDLGEALARLYQGIQSRR